MQLQIRNWLHALAKQNSDIIKFPLNATAVREGKRGSFASKLQAFMTECFPFHVSWFR
jgi:hypothetical protein